MVYDRKYIDTVADIVCDALEIRRPLTVKQLCETIKAKLHGSCVSKDTVEDDAKIIISDDNSFVIEYATNTPEVRLLFSIAYELGHLFLHYLKEDGSGILKTEETVNIQETEEWEANEFAAYLLMPDELFISKCKDFSENGKIPINKIADYFHVSNQAAFVRGLVLGLWT